MMFNPREKPVSEMSEFEVRLRSTWTPHVIHDQGRVEQVLRDFDLMRARKSARRPVRFY
jgi:hypothetical protein